MGAILEVADERVGARTAQALDVGADGDAVPLPVPVPDPPSREPVGLELHAADASTITLAMAILDQPIDAPKQRFAGAFGVRHQAGHIALLIADAGDVQQRTVWIRGNLINASLPAGSYAGIKVTGGSFKTSQHVTTSGDNVEVAAPLKGELKLELAADTVTPAAGACSSADTKVKDLTVSTAIHVLSPV